MSANGTAVRPMTEPALRAHVQRMLKESLKLGLPERVERVELGLYLVPSKTTPGTVYTVTGDDVPLACTCQAQAHTPLCVHRAAVLIRRWRAEGRQVALDDVGDVVVLTEVDAAALAFPAGLWPEPLAVPGGPPLPSADDLTLDLDDLEEDP